jgi:CRISPR-associated endonuclease/helicase Cas3
MKARNLTAQVFFEDTYRALTGCSPYPWQHELFRRFVETGVLKGLNLPTGTGKTSIIPIWLIACAYQLESAGTLSLPTRLAYIVDRRSVVDQSTKIVEDLVRAIESAEANSSLVQLREVFAKLSLPKERCLGVSTLRGEFADNGEWSRIPSRISIICGTVDMVGSRLLFNGYGDGSSGRALHAGLLGNDTLIVFDEAHLVPAFNKLLRNVEKAGGKFKPFKYVLMSATSLSQDADEVTLTDADLEHPTLKGRLTAPKRLHIVEVGGEREVAPIMIKQATNIPPSRTIVFVRSPNNVRIIAEALRKQYLHVVTLTGTMRGLERDNLVKNPVFGAFTKKDSPAEPHFLVATSAGEVGIDLTCDRIVSDMSSLPSMLQRFGRCNRFGETEAEIYLVFQIIPVSEQERDPDKRQKAREYLESLKGDVSCLNLWKHRNDAALKDALPNPHSVAKELPGWVLNLWAMTSIKHSPAPEADIWLRGKEKSSAYVEVTWRHEVSLLHSMKDEDFETYLRKFRVFSYEKLQEPVRYIGDKLKSIAALRPERDYDILIVRPNLERMNIRTITELLEYLGDDEEKIYELTNCLLMLSPQCGGLSSAMLSPTNDDDAKLDIAEDGEYQSKRKRALVVEDEGWDGNSGIEVVDAEELRAIRSGWKTLLDARIPLAEHEARLLILGEREKRAEGQEVRLDDHNDEVGEFSLRFAELCGMSPDLLEVFKFVGCHDLGKSHAVWQAAVGGSVKAPLAKSKPGVRFDARVLDGYRHEFGTLRQVTRPESWADVQWELALHLIACHHNGARPSFTGTGDNSPATTDREGACAVMRRFGKLQQKYGVWGLAYLEAILRAADGYVSRDNNG